MDTIRVSEFSSGLNMLAQQKGSRFRNYVRFVSGSKSKRVSIDQIGSTAARKVTTRFADTVPDDVPLGRRWLTPQTYRWAAWVDRVDLLRTMHEPTSEYMLAGINAMGRAMDDVIIAAFYADAQTAEEAGSTVSYDSNMTVAVNSWAYGVGSGNAGLTISKLIEARMKLRAGETGFGDDGVDAYIAVTAKQEANLLATTEATSTDYSARPSLVNGRIDKFLGFQFIHTERLPVDGSGYRRNPVWLKDGIGLAIYEDIVTRVDERPDKNYLKQVWAEMDLAAARIEESKVGSILCLEA